MWEALTKRSLQIRDSLVRFLLLIEDKAQKTLSNICKLIVAIVPNSLSTKHKYLNKIC